MEHKNIRKSFGHRINSHNTIHQEKVNCPSSKNFEVKAKVLYVSSFSKLGRVQPL